MYSESFPLNLTVECKAFLPSKKFTSDTEMHLISFCRPAQDSGRNSREDWGEMGRYQISRLTMYCFLMFAPTFQYLNMYFLAAEAPWQCAQNTTVCKLNGSFTVGDPDYDFRWEINRSDWEFALYEGPHDSRVSEVSRFAKAFLHYPFVHPLFKQFFK